MTTPISENQPPRNDPSSERSFVESCFSFDISQEKEGRIWSDIDAFKPVPDLVRNKKFETAWSILDQHQDAFADFDFIYIWQSIILQKNRQTDAAEETIVDGLKHAKAKHVLCDRMGHIAYDAQQMPRAIKWWIRSIVLMVKERQITMWEPFLYLAYVAKGIGNETAFKALMHQVGQTSVHGELQLEPSAEQKLTQQLKDIDTEPIQNALEHLCGMIPQNDSHPDPPKGKKQETQGSASGKIKGKMPRVAPRKDRSMIWGIAAGVIILMILKILFFSGDPSPDKAAQPNLTPETQTDPSPMLPAKAGKGFTSNPAQIPLVNGKISPPDQQSLEHPYTGEKIPERETADTPVSETPDPAPPVPSKEKHRWIKVKTKTALPGIKKKTDQTKTEIEHKD